jgi:uroporphyrinogen-III synthase
LTAPAAPPPLLVTRPAREAARWVQELQRLGLAAQALPLIDIGPAPNAAAVAQVRRGLASFRAVMFVSANAVEGLLGAAGADAAACATWPADGQGPRAWATGPGTRQALRAAGVPPALIDAPAADAAQFDSEALWARVHKQVSPGDRVLIARGGDAQGRPAGRNWLAGELASAGARVETLVAYVRRPPVWTDVQRRAAASPGAWWLLSSSEALANLPAVLPGYDVEGARALCTHPRIADAARAAGFGRVETVQPLLTSVAAFLQSGE